MLLGDICGAPVAQRSEVCDIAFQHIRESVARAPGCEFLGGDVLEAHTDREQVP